MSPSSSVEVLDSALPDQLEHRASLLLKFYAERNSSGNQYVPKRPKQSRERWFLVEAGWFNRLKLGAGNAEATETWFKCQDPGPLDNSCLMDSRNTSRLRERLIEGHDYIAVSEAFWMNLKNWYRVVGPEILRYGTSRGEIEVYPPIFRICFTKDESEEWDNSKEFQMEFSRDTTIAELFAAVEKRIGQTGLVIKHASYSDFAAIKYDDDTAGETTVRQMGWNSGDRFLVVLPAKPSSLSATTATSSYISSVSTSVMSTSQAIVGVSPNPVASWSPAPAENKGDGLGTRLKNGLCGLQNLGNTCYMNAVLQCLSHTAPLRAKLISGSATKSVNAESKFGRKGDVVKETSELFREMWSGRNKSVAPYAFKSALDRWTPMFRGYQQQDAHEALVFLLDGLHEDTNFGDAKTKPSLAETVNMGSFQSRLVCPICSTDSVSSESFQVVSLDMPLQLVPKSNQAMYEQPSLTVMIVPVDGPLKSFIMARDGNDTITALAEKVRRSTGMTDVVLARVRKDISEATTYQTMELMTPLVKIDSIPVGWDIVAYELSSERRADTSFVQGLHRLPTGKVTGVPFILPIDDKTTKKHLAEMIEARFGRAKDRYALKMALKFKTDARDLVADDSPCSMQMKYGAQLLVIEWVSECPAVSEQSFATAEPAAAVEGTQAVGAEEKRPDTLQDRLNAFCAVEVLGQDDLWSCPKCQEKRAASKQISFAEPLPEVLILHLKRFNSMGAKLSTSISFAPFIHLNKIDYELNGIIRHHGATISGGHYDALVRSSSDLKWYHCDDSRVMPVPNVQMGGVSLPGILWNDPSAYIFFFRKKNTAAL